jgi:hypothetical protein
MTTPHPTGPAVVVRKPWYRRVPAALFVGIAVFVGVVLLASYQYWPNLFVVPHTFAGLILWVVKLLLFAGVIVGLIWLLLLVLGSTVVGSIVVIAMALLLALPFLFSLVAGMRAGAHNAQSQATARPTVTEPTTIRPTVTEPTTITPTETAQPTEAPNDNPQPAPPQSVSVPPVTTEQPPPPATSLVPVGITPPGQPMPPIFQLSGTGDIPDGQQIVVFVYAKGTQLFYTQSQATALANHQWVAQGIYLGDNDVCDNGQPYPVFAVRVDSATAANLAPRYTKDAWSQAFGRFQRAQTTVTRTGKLIAC